MANIETPILGPQHSETVYNTMRNIFDKDTAYIQSLKDQIEEAEDFLISFMRSPKDAKLMGQLLDYNKKAVAKGQKGKAKTRIVSEK